MKQYHFGSKEMDLEKLEKIMELAIDNLSKCTQSAKLTKYPALQAEIEHLMYIATKALPEHQTFFFTVIARSYNFTVSDAYDAIEHIEAILRIEKASEKKLKEMKIFEGASEKMKQAAVSFRKNDYPSTFHNLNTTLELVLKDKLGIPTTITKINTSRIIDILAKHKVELYRFLTEIRKHVVLIDNKIKHQGYSPSKIDCINGIKAMEELISKLRDKDIKLTDEIKNKIFEGL